MTSPHVCVMHESRAGRGKDLASFLAGCFQFQVSHQANNLTVSSEGLVVDVRPSM